MTGKKFLLFMFLQAVVFTLAKLWLLGGGAFVNPFFSSLLLWIITAVLTIGLVRRFGSINFMEVAFIFVVWLVLDVLADLLVTSVKLGLGIFSLHQYWINYLVMGLSLAFFHKMRHKEIRKRLRRH